MQNAPADSAAPLPLALTDLPKNFLRALPLPRKSLFSLAKTCTVMADLLKMPGAIERSCLQAIRQCNEDSLSDLEWLADETDRARHEDFLSLIPGLRDAAHCDPMAVGLLVRLMSLFPTETAIVEAANEALSQQPKPLVNKEIRAALRAAAVAAERGSCLTPPFRPSPHNRAGLDELLARACDRQSGYRESALWAARTIAANASQDHLYLLASQLVALEGRYIDAKEVAMEAVIARADVDILQEVALVCDVKRELAECTVGAIIREENAATEIKSAVLQSLVDGAGNPYIVEAARRALGNTVEPPPRPPPRGSYSGSPDAVAPLVEFSHFTALGTASPVQKARTPSDVQLVALIPPPRAP